MSGSLGAWPLSPTQERMFFAHLLDPDNVINNSGVLFRMTGVLDAAALGKALELLAYRHETLRTRFVESHDYTGLQVVEPFALVHFEQHDLRLLPEEARGQELQSAADALVWRPFRLDELPLFRCALYLLAEDVCALVFVVHHIVSDARSIGILMADLAEAYTGIVCDREVDWHSAPASFVEIAAYQRMSLSSDATRQDLAYWRSVLSGAPPTLDLPARGARPDKLHLNCATERIVMSAATASAVRNLARSERVTPFVVLLAGIQVALRRIAGQDDVVCGVPITAQSRSEWSSVVGPLINTVAVRTRTRVTAAYVEAIRDMRDAIRGAMSHRSAPFDAVVRTVNPVRFENCHPLFQVLVNLRKPLFMELEFANVRLCAYEKVAPRSTVFDLHVSLVAVADRYEGSVEYARDLFDRSMIRHVIDTFTDCWNVS